MEIVVRKGQSAAFIPDSRAVIVRDRHAADVEPIDGDRQPRLALSDVGFAVGWLGVLGQHDHAADRLWQGDVLLDGEELIEVVPGGHVNRVAWGGGVDGGLDRASRGDDERAHNAHNTIARKGIMATPISSTMASSSHLMAAAASANARPPRCWPSAR